MTDTHDHAIPPEQAASPLRPEVWAAVNTRIVARAISEFAHERLIQPERLSEDGEWGQYRLPAEGGLVEYLFRAQILALDHWLIDRRSLRKLRAGHDVPLEALDLVVELRASLGLTDETLPGYLEDLAGTLYAAASRQARPALSAAEVARAGFQDIEAAMTEGHPVFVASNGRIGWSAADHPAFAPEQAPEVTLLWLAADERRTSFAAVADLDYRQLIEDELGPALLVRFEGALAARGQDPDRYRFLPVHPWQWNNKLAQLFAADLAAGDLVYLGPGDDRHRPQQSIRTLFNLTRPRGCYVKTALSIRNMGFTRGIHPGIADRGAAVNDWVSGVVQGDPLLRQLGFEVLREVAFMGYRHRYYQQTTTRRSDGYNELLAAVWRESPLGRLRPGQRLMTMAALLHVDREGRAVLPELIRGAGLDATTWLRAYLRAYLVPQLHCLYAHDLVFTPHCENVLLVLEDGLPVRILLKDLAEDCGVLNPPAPLPERVRHLALRVPEALVTLCIFTDAFDGVFRFLAARLQEHAGIPGATLWRLVAETIAGYQAAHPQWADKYRRLDLFAPSFARNCLNRLQLRNPQEMIDAEAADPVDSLQFAGELDNPIAAFAPGLAGAPLSRGSHAH